MKSLIKVFAIIPLALLGIAIWCVLSAPPEPAFAAPDKAAVVARLNHLFLVAAYSMTWAIQLGYLAWLGLKSRAQKHESARSLR